ncbi:carboxylate-amine ligase [Terasakiella sp. A23]|uniref:carboxylate-amine ligase n=1 Tax=Terasakiella sp. FCG-A23 TaxID=3080561 RepID=UPI002952C9D7|nr:carboxylate-amine ligase [Terasakiella sp. A23]MDV7340653.1 carboxylate-amine ligase [Terasakiella sp. A23]
MAVSEPSWTIGIEEEYLMVDRDTGDLSTQPMDAVMAACRKELQDLVRPEFLQSQVEVATDVCKDVKEARKQLAWLRQKVADIGADYNLAPIAASTHPNAEWDEQEHTDAERYHTFAEDMQAVVRRLIISGMHVHVGIDDNDLRIDLMNQVSYFLPHLLALSTSSAFWRGQVTGLKCYRLSVFDELPRTGLPEHFDSFSEYQKHVDALINVGVIKDATMLWWDVRPAVKFPTLEMRITDICTTLDDAVAIAALFQCILRMLYRLRRSNQRWRTYRNMLVNENRWRAQRYGLDEGLVDFGIGQVVAFDQLLEELIDMLKEDAEALNCTEELLSLRTILKRGTSSHRQLDVFAKAKEKGADDLEASRAVSKWLMQETLNGL